MRTCIFCGGRASTKEDAWPLWLFRRLDAVRPGWVNAERGTKPPLSWPAIQPGVRVKFVCAECNNGWMSGLENRMKSVFELLLGEGPTSLDRYEQSIISAWAVKNAMVFEALRDKLPWVFTDEERSRFRVTLDPPSPTTVWLAKSVDPPAAYCSAVDLFGQVAESGDAMRAYLTTMAFGPVSLQVMRINLPSSTPAAITADLRPGPWEKVAIQVWPIRRLISWPPEMGLLGEEGLDAFSRRWSPAM